MEVKAFPRRLSSNNGVRAWRGGSVLCSETDDLCPLTAPQGQNVRDIVREGTAVLVSVHRFFDDCPGTESGCGFEVVSHWR